MSNQRNAAQTTGLVLALLLGFYSVYLHIDLAHSGYYDALFSGDVSGNTLVNLLASVVAVCAMSLGGLFSLVALASPSATGKAAGATLIVSACAGIAREITLLIAYSDVGFGYSAWSIYLDSVEYARIPDKWPVVWATIAVCVLASVLCFRTGTRPAMPAIQAPGFHIHSQGAQYGPFDWAQLHQLVAEGRVQSSTLVWPGEGDWLPAAQIPGLLGAGGPFEAMVDRKIWVDPPQTGQT